jgi:hypothetical protein
MAFPQLSKTVWTIIIGIGVVGGAIGTLFLVEDRYAKARDLITLEDHMYDDVDHKIVLVENKSVQTFESYQMKQNTINKGLQLQILNVQYDNLTDRYYTLKRMLRDNPNNSDLRNEFNEVQRQRENVKQQREQLLRQ